jgi:acetyltransferase-like isoleucine patch superfamily enzyme
MLIERKRIPLKEIILIGFLPGFIKKIIYSLKGNIVSKKAKLRFGSVIIGKRINIKEYSEVGFFAVIIADSIEIGRNSKIGALTYINCQRFSIGDDSKIREQVSVGGTLNPDSELIVGDRCSIGQSCYINPSRRIEIGDDTAVGGGSFIFTHGSWQSVLDGYPVKYEPVIIGRNVYIAWRVFILPGITIGDNSTIAADSTVTISIPPNSLASGSPIKIALKGVEKWPRTLTFKTKIKIIEDIHDKFYEYLNFYGFTCALNRTEEFDRLNLLYRKQSLVFFKTNSSEINFTKNCTYLFLGNTLSTTGLHNSIMILDYENRTRLGSNDLGEEYVRYLSRYGIRFKRVNLF